MMFDETAKPTIVRGVLKFFSKKQNLIAIFVSTILATWYVLWVNQPLKPLTITKSPHEVFGFAPYWTFHKLNNVDFNVLTTFAYFGIDVNPDGSLEKSGPGYDTFVSQEATAVFKRAHQSGTRVVLTLTQMKNDAINQFLDNPEAQELAINESIGVVRDRGIDGANIDFEYVGDPGQEYRDKFSSFVGTFTARMHQEIPSSKVTVSVYAASVKEPKIYDIANLGKSADGVFMMAYDFATARSDNAVPTAPLYGYKEGKYWYDVSTAVDDFLTKLPPEKLILGVPWYGYNYAVDSPEIKAAVNKGYYQYYKRSFSASRKVRTYSYFVPFNTITQTYSAVQKNVPEDATDSGSFQTGWDDYGKVGYKAYFSETDGIWRMVFIDDPKSLALKYELAKTKNLAGVGIWALGFDNGSSEMWTLLSEKFGTKLADSDILNRTILDTKRE